jgi:AcrR family transcriptional regulator
MPNRTTDPRVIRTRKMLRDALMACMQEKGLEGITVRDLTSRAGLYRGTFYLHYRDIYDLLEQSKEEMLQGIREIASRVDPKDFQQANWLDEPHPDAVRMFEYYADNAAFFQTILGPKGDASFVDKLKALLAELFRRNFALLRIEEEHMPIPPDYFISYIVSANIGLIQNWAAKGMAETPREIAMMAMKMRIGLAKTTGM